MKSVKKHIRWAFNYISVLYSIVIKFLGYEYDSKVIPTGFYCYEPDETKDPMKTICEEGVYYIKPCPYYKSLGYGRNGCKYLGIITDDIVFDDQCKLCSVNRGDEYDE